MKQEREPLTQEAHEEATSSPRSEYRSRIESLRSDLVALEARDGVYSNTRFITFIAMVAVGIFAANSASVSFWWLLLPLSVFVVLIVRHSSVVKAIHIKKDAVRFYESGIARMDDNWQGLGTPGDSWLPENHAYAHDLDLFGRGSLFELLNTTRTQFGERTLASWLCKPSDVKTIQSRREAIGELKGNLDLREALGIAGSELRSGLHPIRLKSWAQTRDERLSPVARWTARGLTLASFWAFWHLFSGGVLLYFPLLTLFFVNVWFQRSVARHFEVRMAQIDGAVQDLRLFVVLAECLESETFTSPLLKKYQERLVKGDQNASTSIKRLERMFVALEQVRNQMFAPLAILWLWIVHVLDLIEGWRQVHGENVLGWMDAIGEIEALCAVATYAYEHPDDVDADLAESTTPKIHAKQLGHPLLPTVQCVRNDITLDSDNGLIIVSGSNMSGKSTYLRTIGANIVLALMGAPVRAASMTITPCMIGASIHVEDSIQEGISHFYAEILRLKLIESLAAEALPVVFLIDEILHGTNSTDRRTGTEAVMRHLLKRGAVGLITTHDLELTRMQGLESARVRNVHFQDQLEGDTLQFDYRVREGVVEKSNALALMRSIGIDIDEPTS